MLLEDVCFLSGIQSYSVSSGDSLEMMSLDSLKRAQLKSILEQYYGADIPAELLFDVNTTFVQLVKAVAVAMEREMDRRSRSIGSRFSGRSRSEARRKQRSTHLPSGRSARSSAARFDGLFVETYFGWT